MQAILPALFGLIGAVLGGLIGFFTSAMSDRRRLSHDDAKRWDTEIVDTSSTLFATLEARTWPYVNRDRSPWDDVPLEDNVDFFTGLMADHRVTVGRLTLIAGDDLGGAAKDFVGAAAFLLTCDESTFDQQRATYLEYRDQFLAAAQKVIRVR